VLAIDGDGEKLCEIPVPLAHAAIEQDLLKGKGGAIAHPGAFMRTDAVRRVGGYRPEYDLAEDLDLFLRLGEIGELANIDEVLLLYRLHTSSTNATKRRRQVEVVGNVLADVCRRRGLPTTQPLVASDPGPTENLHTRLGHMAIVGRNYPAARRHARKAILKNPLHPACWRLLLAAHLPFGVSTVKRRLWGSAHA
jgi:hypothetical protein